MKIAVAINGSENAIRAAEHAIMLAKALPDAHLEVIYVADYDKAVADRLVAQSPETLALKREQKMKPVLDLTDDTGLEVKTAILRGNPSQVLIKYIKTAGIDQLVIGSRGLNSFQEMMLGSVSHKVMKLAECPVTIVK